MLMGEEVLKGLERSGRGVDWSRQRRWWLEAGCEQTTKKPSNYPMRSFRHREKRHEPLVDSRSNVLNLPDP